MGKFVITYWDLRGFAEPARMLLEYGGIEYENRLVTDGQKWFAEKFSLGMDFPNLPYIIDGDVKLTESWAIYRYLGKKFNLFPTSEEDQRQADMLQGVINDIRVGFVRYIYGADLYEKIDELRKNQSGKVDLMEKYLKDRKFLIGNDLSFLDFALFETFDHHRLFFTDIFDQSPNIQNYMKRFESLPRIANYLSSARYKKFPINGSMASWGGQKENDRK
ncbi:glutathione S-transferase class-mu 26 kDa isozyme 47-like [Styela clava]